MSYNSTVSSGKLNISEHTVAQIAQQAAKEVEGVAGFLPLPVSLKEYLLRAKRAESIKIAINGGTACITLGIELSGSVSAEKVARAVQQEVKSAVQNMTGLAVSKVNVTVMGIADE